MANKWILHIFYVSKVLAFGNCDYFIAAVLKKYHRGHCSSGQVVQNDTENPCLGLLKAAINPLGIGL
jgi:hypothetical protein